ncbi:MAG TPA: transaldolase [Acidimicrobiales bacterium]|nr:transaldolase [Acidimicrobiales bacterium]
MTSLNDLYADYGQSPWIDNIRRDWLVDGTLAAFVTNGVRGVTSNPSIFAKALATSTAYDQLIASSSDDNAEDLFETLAVHDVRDACDVLAQVHETSRADFAAGRRRYLDGFVSLEVSPRLARDTEGTIAAARRLHAKVDRPNVMIKIPATKEGLPAIRATLGAGINVNVTLIFSLARYDEVIEAWSAGVRDAYDAGHDVGAIASVASFFVSRVDVAVDALLPMGDPRRGTTANAQAAAAYVLYRSSVSADPVSSLLANGAQVQRPLWASTSTKNPTYDDLLYVNRLVGDETVNTMPDATLADALDHPEFSSSYLLSKETTHAAAAELETLSPDVDLDRVTQQLEEEGVASFAKSYDDLLATVSSKMKTSK